MWTEVISAALLSWFKSLQCVNMSAIICRLSRDFPTTVSDILTNNNRHVWTTEFSAASFLHRSVNDTHSHSSQISIIFGRACRVLLKNRCSCERYELWEILIFSLKACITSSVRNPDDSRCVLGGLCLRSGDFHILSAETEPRKQTYPHTETRFHPVRETLSVLRAQTDQTTGYRSEPTTQ